MRKIIKKLFLLFLIVSLSSVSAVNCVGEIDVVRSYNLLKYEYKSFLDPLINSGATEEGLISYFKDVETQLKLHEDLSEETIESYLKDALLDVATFRQHRNVASVIFGCYYIEIESYMETGTIPPNLQEVYEAVIRALFGDKDKDKTELVKKYETYLAFYNANRNSYTLSSIEALQVSLNKALSVLSDKNATNLSITQAVSDLDTAYGALEKNPAAPSGGGGGGGESSSGNESEEPKDNPTDNPTDVPAENLPATVPEKLFLDVPQTHWGKTAIVYLAEKNIVNGFTDGTFRPDALITREQFATMLCEAFDLPLQYDTPVYSDVQSGAWYERYVFIISQSGLMKGIGEQKFGVGDTLIRQDLAVIADRIIKEGFISKEYEVIPSQETFADMSAVSGYAKSAVLDMHKYGIVNGVGANSFEPFGGVTRAQAAQIIYNLVK